MTVAELQADPRYQRLSPALQSQALRAVALGGSADAILAMAPAVAAPASNLSAILAAEPNETVRTPTTGESPAGWDAYTQNSQNIYQSFVNANIAAGMSLEDAKNTATVQYQQWGQAQHDQMYSDANSAPLGINELAPIAGNNGLNAPLGVLIAGLTAGGAAGSLGGPGSIAAAGGTADAAATGGAAAAGGGGDATLQSILDSAAPAGESFTGPATGTVLEPGVQASGAFVNPVAATPTLAELGATDLAPLAAAGAGAAAGATAGAAGGGGGAGALETGAAGAGGAAAATEAAKQSTDGTGALDSLGLGGAGDPATQAEIDALTKGLDGLGGGLGGLDLSKILGTGALTAGSIAADQYRTDAMTNLADKYTALGAPSRARYEASFDPNFDVNSIPGFTNALNTSRDAVLRKFSTSGDPFGNPGQLTEAMNYLSGNLALPAIQNYRNQNAATGGFGAFSTAAPGLASGAIDSNSSAYSDLGRGVSDIFNPPSDLATILKKFQSGSGSVI